MASEAPTTGYLEIVLSEHKKAEFCAWRDQVLKVCPIKPKDVPDPHITLFFDCVPDEKIALGTARKHFGDRIHAEAHHVKAGERKRVLLLGLHSEGLERLFETLFNDETVNPKAADCSHMLFDYAKRGTRDMVDNRLGFAAHLTVAWFDESDKDALEAFAKTVETPMFTLQCRRDDLRFEAW